MSFVDGGFGGGAAGEDWSNLKIATAVSSARELSIALTSVACFVYCIWYVALHAHRSTGRADRLN